MTLLDRLRELFPNAKTQTLKRMIEARRVRVNGMPARTLKQAIEPTDRIEVADRAKEPKASATLPFPVIHEDGDVLVIDKPPGLLTSTNEREKRPTALAMVRGYLAAKSPRARVGLIHRLDRDASGLLVFSKNPAAFRSLKSQFFEHSVLRVYHAIVKGVPSPPKGRIESRLVEMPDGKVKSTRRADAGERAISAYETIESLREISLMRVTLETGKKHQIRVHLSERGWAIVNDPLYNPKASRGRLMLIATTLEFDHPRTGKRMRFDLPLPKSFDDELRALRK
jgi:23S rRNA pseudouridine1911/1915/1917 synthase